MITVQTILGHEKVDTTLGYARLYDGTIASDYYRAMEHIEHQFALTEDDSLQVPRLGDLIALIDTLDKSGLDESQRHSLQLLRQGIKTLIPELWSADIEHKCSFTSAL